MQCIYTLMSIARVYPVQQTPSGASMHSRVVLAGNLEHRGDGLVVGLEEVPDVVRNLRVRVRVGVGQGK